MANTFYVDNFFSPDQVPKPSTQTATLSVETPIIVYNIELLPTTVTSTLTLETPLVVIFDTATPATQTIAVVLPPPTIFAGQILEPTTLAGSLSVETPNVEIRVTPVNIGIPVDVNQPPFDLLYCWSEPTIKTDGNFSLGCQANVGSLGETLTHTFDGRVL